MFSPVRQVREFEDGDIVGQFRRFGEHGPAYEVTGIEEKGVARIRVLESGEVLNYPIAKIQSDPEA